MRLCPRQATAQRRCAALGSSAWRFAPLERRDGPALRLESPDQFLWLFLKAPCTRDRRLPMCRTLHGLARHHSASREVLSPAHWMKAWVTRPVLDRMLEPARFPRGLVVHR